MPVSAHVLARTSTRKRWKGSHVLVISGNRRHTRWSAATDAVLSGRVERFSAGTRLKTIEVFNEQGESRQLKLFPAEVEPPEDDPNVARVLLSKVRLERSRQFGNSYVGLELWRRLQLDRFGEELIDDEQADVAWSRITALLSINRLCEPASEQAIEERWYPATALDDLLGIAEGKVNDTRLYRCFYRLIPHKTKQERHLRQRYGELFAATFDVLLYDLTSSYVEGQAEKQSDDAPRLLP